MGEILADSSAEGERIANGGVDVRGAFHVDEIFMDGVRGGLDEACYCAVAGVFCSFGNFCQLGEIWDVSAWGHPIKMFFVEIVADGGEVLERHAAGFRSRGFVNEDNGFSFEAQAAMVRENVGDVNPVAVAVFVRRDTRGGKSSEAEGKTALAIVVDGAEADFVVTFVDGSVVEEFGGVKEMVAVHAGAA
jgi:hypothetical protein